MKQVLILLALSLSVFCAFAQGVTLTTPEGSVSMSISGLLPEGVTDTGYVIDEIAARLETLQEDYLVKLKKTDSRKANKLVDEIYELLYLLPSDDVISGSVIPDETTTNNNSNANSNSNSNTSNININIIDSQTQQTQVTPPPPPPPPPVDTHQYQGTRKLISDSEFGDLISRIGKESFSDDQLRVLRTAAKNYRFNCSQIVRLIGAYTYSDDKIQALQISYPDCPDPQNNFKILDAFTYSSDKEEAERIMDSN